MPEPSKRVPTVFIGTYTEKEGSQSKGIYVYRMDLSSGELTFQWEAKGILNPSYLTIHPQMRFLYTVNEVQSFGGQDSGGVTALSIDSASVELNLLNAYSSQGKDPCYISVEQTGRFALVANVIADEPIRRRPWRERHMGRRGDGGDSGDGGYSGDYADGGGDYGSGDSGGDGGGFDFGGGDGGFGGDFGGDFGGGDFGGF